MTILNKPYHRVTRGALPASFGSDRDRRIVVTLLPGNGDDVPDLLELRPQGTRRPERLALIDVYHFAIRCRVNRTHLERAREKKLKKQASREQAAIARTERRLARPMVSEAL